MKNISIHNSFLVTNETVRKFFGRVTNSGNSYFPPMYNNKSIFLIRYMLHYNYTYDRNFSNRRSSFMTIPTLIQQNIGPELIQYLWSESKIFERSKNFENSNNFVNSKVFVKSNNFENSKIFVNSNNFVNSKVFVKSNNFVNSKIFVKSNFL